MPKDPIFNEIAELTAIMRGISPKTSTWQAMAAKVRALEARLDAAATVPTFPEKELSPCRPVLGREGVV